MKSKDDKVAIIVAVISLCGAIGVAVIGNWDRIFPPIIDTSISTPNSADTPTLAPTRPNQGLPLIAFASNSSGKAVIYTMRVDGSDQHPITSSEHVSDSPSWSPDGEWIFFISNREGNFNIYKMRWDGSDLTSVTTGDQDEYGPRMSPNGSKIAYSVKFGKDYYQLFVMNSDGSGVQNISNLQMSEYLASWSPNSRWFVFSYCKGPNSPTDLACEIYRMNADGSDRRNITNSPYS